MSKENQIDNRRKYYRNTTQKVVLVIEEKPYLAIDWSPGGFSIKMNECPYHGGDEIRGYIDIFELEDMGEFTGRIVRYSADKTLAVEFEKLSSHVFMNLCMTVGSEKEDAD